MEYFCSLELKKELMLKDPTVRWLIEEKKTTFLEEKNLFSLLRVHEQVVFLNVSTRYKRRAPGQNGDS